MDTKGQRKYAKKQRYFSTRELHFSIAFLTTLALLAGIFLQNVSTWLIARYGISATLLGVFLVVGYILIVVLISVFFTHRLCGPFKRIEYEMKLISRGDLSRRLGVRTQDDLHIRNFIKYTNDFLASFEDMSKEYNNLNSTVSTRLEEITNELAKEKFDCEALKKEIIALNGRIREFRERW